MDEIFIILLLAAHEVTSTGVDNVIFHSCFVFQTHYVLQKLAFSFFLALCFDLINDEHPQKLYLL